MPIKPKLRPIGQEVITTKELHFREAIIPEGTITSVLEVKVGEDYKVSYKILYRGHYLWVKAADIKTFK